MNISESFNKIKALFLENRSLYQVLFKNITWLSFSEIVTRLLTLILAIFIARILGAENYGLLTFAISFTALFSILSNFCSETIIIREFNQKEEVKNELGSILWLKIFLGIVVVLFIIGASFFVKTEAAQPIIIIFAGMIFISIISSFFEAIFKALQKMEYVAIAKIGKTIILATGGFLVLFTRPDITFIAYVYFLSTCFAFLIVFFIAKYLSILPRPVLDLKIVKKYLSLSWPLGLIAVFATIYVQIDSVMMGFWNMIEEIGWYQAAYKLINFAIVPGSIITMSFFPVLSKSYKQTKEHFQKIINTFFEALAFFALPIVAGGFLLSQEIITFLYPEEFLPSILAFKILIFVSGLILFIMFISSVLVVTGRQKTIFYITGSTALLNIILNFILIPKYSLYGAAIATVVSYIFLFLLGLTTLKKIDIILSLKIIFAPFLAVTFMILFLYLGIIQNMHVVFQILIAGFIYFFVFLGIRYILKRNFKDFKKIYAK